LITVKQKLYKLCQDFITARIADSRQAITVLQADANEETKSSSGDKYETGRAMMQIEIEKLSSQLSESVKQKNQLDKVTLDKSDKIQPGSLVVTDQGIFFISTSIGQFDVDGKLITCISPASPLAIQLMQRATGAEVLINKKRFVIQEIW
jgi:transcription elongation GreA/GreB family factor